MSRVDDDADRVRYLDWVIYYDSSVTQLPWRFVHFDFDGDPEVGDDRFGVAASISDARAEIDAWIEENEGDAAH